MNKYIYNLAFVILTAAVAIALGLNLPKIVREVRDFFVNHNYEEHVTGLPHNLTLYGTTTCTYCANARKFLIDAGIPFNDILIDQSKTAAVAYNKLDEKYVPVLVFKNGMIVGFDSKKYKNLIYSKKLFY